MIMIIMATYYVPNIIVLLYLKYHNKHFCKHYYHMSHIMLQGKKKHSLREIETLFK